MKQVRGLDERDGVYTIYPEDALALLANTSGKNRKLRMNTVLKYKNRMANGEWVLTGEPIILTHNGKFPADGKHRLAACHQSGKPFTAVVLHCVGETYKWDAMGQGNSRSLGDVLGASGQKYNVNVAVVLRNVILHDRARDLGISMLSLSKAAGDWRDLDNRVAESYLSDHSFIAEQVCYFMPRYSRDKLIPMGPAASAYVLIRRSDPRNVEEFFEGLMTGENLSGADPRFQLRRRLTRERASSTVSRSRTGSMGITYTLGLILKAYKFWKANRAVNNISVRLAEAFPFIEGTW